jgi:hypothetical protein
MSATEVIQPLDRAEIDRRLSQLGQDIAGFSAEDLSHGIPGDLRPRWITPAELIGRMRPFLVYS